MVDKLRSVPASAHYYDCHLACVQLFLQVFDRDRRLKASLYLATPLAAAAFLNDAGDILVAPVGAKHLMVVWASTYAGKHGHQQLHVPVQCCLSSSLLSWSCTG